MVNESSVEIEENEIICNCFQITEITIRSHILKKNIGRVKDVTLVCKAGGNCGSCHMLIQLFIDQNKNQKMREHISESEISQSKNNKVSFWKKLLPST